MAAVGGQIYGVLRGSLAVQCRVYYVPLGSRLLSQLYSLHMWANIEVYLRCRLSFRPL